MKNITKCKTSISNRSSRIPYVFRCLELELELEVELERGMLDSSLLGDEGDWGDEGAVGN